MAIRKVSPSEATRDGRMWVFETYYKDERGKRKLYKSKKYLTKSDAKIAEREYLLSKDNENVLSNMTFSKLCLEHMKYNEDKVKKRTLLSYIDRRAHLSYFDDIKLVDLNINHFEKWKCEINKLNLKTNTKNDLYKYLRCVLNYGHKWFNYDYNGMLPKMTNFTNPNEVKEEMKFYTKEEFDKFLSVEDNLLYRTMFETFYFCGLRMGELRGLQWGCIDLDNKQMHIKKQVIKQNINEEKVKMYIEASDDFIKKHKSNKPYELGNLKTLRSVRVIPIPETVSSSLKQLKKMQEELYGFNDDWFVFGNILPHCESAIRRRKDRNCSLSGVKKIRIHDFRHSCASLLINNGGNITMIARYLGHSKVEETLNTYSHMFKNELVNIVNIVDKMC